jgi:hypothetical protein
MCKHNKRFLSIKFGADERTTPFRDGRPRRPSRLKTFGNRSKDCILHHFVIYCRLLTVAATKSVINAHRDAMRFAFGLWEADKG